MNDMIALLRIPAGTSDEMMAQAAQAAAACIPGCSIQYPGRIPAKIPQIRMVLTDCDGCLTDSGMYYTENGDELKKFNARDGGGFQLLRERGIIIGIITGEDRQLNRRRADKLKLDVLVSGCTDKLAALEQICRQFGVDPQNTAYIGDDRADVPVLRRVGFGAAPRDAVPQAIEAADYISAKKGGEGVLREVAELLLEKDRLRSVKSAK